MFRRGQKAVWGNDLSICVVGWGFVLGICFFLQDKRVSLSWTTWILRNLPWTCLEMEEQRRRRCSELQPPPAKPGSSSCCSRQPRLASPSRWRHRGVAQLPRSSSARPAAPPRRRRPAYWQRSWTGRCSSTRSAWSSTWSLVSTSGSRSSRRAGPRRTGRSRLALSARPAIVVWFFIRHTCHTSLIAFQTDPILLFPCHCAKVLLQ